MVGSFFSGIICFVVCVFLWSFIRSFCSCVGSWRFVFLMGFGGLCEVVRGFGFVGVLFWFLGLLLYVVF